MPHSLFISDLHLNSEHPHSSDLLLHFAEHTASQAEALYILGDLFEYWAGDDDSDDAFYQHICRIVRGISDQGTRVFIMHGNRDFLMSDKLATACHATLLADPTLINLYGTPTLLSHGDALCTDDAAYQQFRQMVRNSDWRSQFLSQPLSQRKDQIEKLRVQSEQAKRVKAMDIMDVNNDSVNKLLRQYHYPRLIHGHTHRPAKHLHHIDGHTCERWVLGDWDNKANALRCNKDGINWETIP